VGETKHAQPAASTAGRRERKRQESRERLYAAAIDLFLEQGFDPTTVDQIANRADVARATAFNYFPQKIAYLEEWGRRRRRHVRTRLALHAPDADTGANHLSRYLREMAMLNTSSRSESQVLMDPSIRLGQALRSPTLDVDLADVVRDGQATGEFRPEVDAAQVGVVLAASYFSTVLRWATPGPPPFDLDLQLQHTLDLVIRGLGSVDGGE
jgi:AcrR family transcriptional regulator